MVFFLVGSNQLVLGGMPHLLIVPLAWVSVRFETRESMTLFPLMSMIALAATVMGYGPFIGRQMPLVSVGLMMVGFGLASLLLAAVGSTRRQAESELTKARLRLESACVAGSAALYEWNLSTNSLEWSDNVDAMLGFLPGEFPRTFSAWESRIYPDDHAATMSRLDNHLKKGTPYEIDYRIQRKNETYVWWHEVGAARRDANGRPITMSGACTDVTARKEAEEALKTSEERYRTVIDFTSDWEYWIGPDNQFRYVSPSSEELTGYKPEEFLTDPGLLLNIVHPDDRDPFAQHLQDLPTHSDACHLEFRIIARNAGILWIDHRCRPVFRADGSYLGHRSSNRNITDRKRAEEERARLTTILESTNDLVAMATPNGIVCYINAAGRRMLGLSEQEDLRGYRISESHPQWASDLVSNTAIPTAAKEGLWEGETVIRYRDGREVPVSQIIMAHRSADGELLYLSTIMRDISERKRAEEETRLNEQRFEALFRLNQMVDATLNELCQFAMEEAVRLTRSTIGYIAFCNEDESLLTMYAWSKAAMQECSIQDRPLIYPVGSTGLWGEAVRQRQPIITNDYSLPNPWKKGHPEGHVHVMRHMNAPIFDGNHIVIVAGVGNKPTDYDEIDVRQLTLLMQGMWSIVQRRQTDEALRRSEENYRGIFDASNEAMFIHDTSGAILDVNRRMCELFGISREEAVRLQFKDFSNGEPPYSQAEAIQWVEKAYQSGPQLFEWLCKRRDGRLFWGEVALSRVRIDGQDRILAAARDITSRKQLEEQLRQAQKMEAVGQLAGGVAHDFNNLLQAINGFTDMALQDIEADHAARPLLQEVAKAGDRAASLVRQLLAFSRRQVIHPEYLDLNEVIAGLLKMLVRVLGEHIRINFVPGHSPGNIYADRGQIEQVLMNLSLNARDAMPAGGTLTIETACIRADAEYCQTNTWARPGEFVVLTIMDNGCGMDAETLKHIFDPFFTTKEVGKGTGLGLATVYGIVRQHEGMINVYSELGTGTVFRIYLPKSGRPVEVVEIAQPEQTYSGTETILLAEDDEIVRNLSRRLLQEAGYTVLLAEDGQEALRVAQEHGDQIALALLDVVMPRMGGREVYERLRHSHPRMRFLFASGYSVDFFNASLMPKEGLELVQKPFDPKMLLSRIRKILDRS